MQVYFTLNVGRKYRDSCWCPVNSQSFSDQYEVPLLEIFIFYPPQSKNFILSHTCQKENQHSGFNIMALLSNNKYIV